MRSTPSEGNGPRRVSCAEAAVQLLVDVEIENLLDRLQERKFPETAGIRLCEFRLRSLQESMRITPASLAELRLLRDRIGGVSFLV